MRSITQSPTICAATALLAAVLSTASAQSQSANLERARVILEVEQDYATAEKELRTLIAKSKDPRLSARAQLLLARALRDLGRTVESDAILEQAIKLAPDLSKEASAVRQISQPQDKLRARVQSEIAKLFDPKTRAAAREQLRWIGEQASPTLFDMLPHVAARLENFKALASAIFEVGGPISIKTIETYAKHEDPTLRRVLIDAAVHTTLPDADRPQDSRFNVALAKLLDDKDRRVRAYAVSEIFSYNGSHVEKALQDTESLVRIAALDVVSTAIEVSMKRRDKARYARIVALIAKNFDEDASFRTAWLDHMKHIGHMSAFLRGPEGWAWVLDHAEELSKTGGVHPDAYWSKASAQFFIRALEKAPDMSARAKSWIKRAALTCSAKPTVKTLDETMQLAKLTPRSDWWSRFSPVLGKGDADFVLDNLEVFLRGSRARGAVYNYLLNALGSDWSEDRTLRVVRTVEALADMRLPTTRGPGPATRSSGAATQHIIHELARISKANQAPATHLLQMLAAHGKLSACDDIIPVVATSSQLWELWTQELTQRGNAITASLAKATLQAEPKKTPRSAALKGARNSLLAVASCQGATDIAEVIAEAYRRGLAFSRHPASINNIGARLRGVQWLLSPHDMPMLRSHPEAEVLEIVERCLDADQETHSSGILSDLAAAFANPKSRSTEALAKLVLSRISKSPEHDAGIVVDAIVGRYPDLEGALAIAVRWIEDPAYVAEFVADFTPRSSYLNAILRALPVAAQQKDSDTAEHLISALGEIGSTRALDAIVKQLKSPNHEVRQKAVSILSEHPESQQALAIFDLSTDKDSRVRSSVAYASKSILNPEIAPKLLVLLEDEEEYIRKEAKQSLEALRFLDLQRSHWKAWLAKRGQPSAPLALLAQAKDENRSKEGRLAAVRSLGVFGDPEALPFLIDVLEHADKDFRDAAKAAIERLQRETRASGK